MQHNPHLDSASFLMSNQGSNVQTRPLLVALQLIDEKYRSPASWCITLSLSSGVVLCLEGSLEMNVVPSSATRFGNSPMCWTSNRSPILRRYSPACYQSRSHDLATQY